VLNSDTLIVDDNACGGILDLLRQLCNNLLLLNENRIAGHFVLPPIELNE
jgi:hypothetical protein